ncbi:MAG: formylglycine-generating enzyme family protein [Blastocatellia bacterium]
MSRTVSIASARQGEKTSETLPRPAKPPDKDLAWIPGGTFMMGSNKHYPEEAPAHVATVGGFWMDQYPVTNEQFQRFVEKTGYVTFAERPPKAEDYPGAQPEMLVPGSVVFAQPKWRVDLRNHYNWWSWVTGADWRHPEGPDSSLDGRENHPVVHVAFEDAEAYAAWAGKQLPTEAEWEFAARGGLEGAEFAWGDEFTPQGKIMANTWQGEFPVENLLTDGFERTSPVGYFPPNGYGLYDLAGNVWEWTTDWYQDRHQILRPCCGSVTPMGGDREKSYDPATPEVRIPRKVVKGGSFLCASNYCMRYRPAARIPQAIDTSTCHQGFRCIVRV